MSDDIKEILKDAEKSMQKALEAMETDFHSMRTGRASPALVEKLQVEYYGSDVQLLTLASISVPEPQVILIKPFDPSTLKAIEKAISMSDLKLNPNNDGKLIRLNIPPLTQERRKDESMITEDEQKRGKEETETLTKRMIEKADELSARKERDVMEN
jgi:ribosome recycling factor